MILVRNKLLSLAGRKLWIGSENLIRICPTSLHSCHHEKRGPRMLVNLVKLLEQRYQPQQLVELTTVRMGPPYSSCTLPR